MSEPLVAIEKLSHSFGTGELRRQVLFDISVEIDAGEIVILTGPSGSGKTTLLTLIGALRSAQSGSLRVLGHELRDAEPATLARVRTRIGYVFQAHNLIDALTAQQNVQMSLQLDEGPSAREIEQDARRALEQVGLGDRADAHPSELSGGQRQRVAIARALARRPRMILADEPTASLDRETGRGVVDLLEKLARDSGTAVVLVTHDSRILDVADRILALEDGRLSSLLRSVTAESENLLHSLIRDIGQGEVARRVRGLHGEELRGFLDGVTAETRRLLDVVDLVQGRAFESMLEQVMEAAAEKLREEIGADHARLYFASEDFETLWSFGHCEHGMPAPDRLPAADVLVAEPGADRRRLAVPVVDSQGRAFAVLELCRDAAPEFSEADRARLEQFTQPLGLILEAWWRMSCACRSGAVGELPPCCRPSPSGGPS